MDNYDIPDKYSVIQISSNKGANEKYFYQNKWFKVEPNENEELVSTMLSYSNYSNYVKYTSCYINGKLGCVSDNFLGEQEELWTVNRIFKYATGKYDIGDVLLYISDIEERITYIIALIKDFTGLDSYEYLKATIYLDALISNYDRHFNNIAFIYNRETKLWKEAPIFDNASCLDKDRLEYCGNFCGTHMACMYAFDHDYKSPILFDYEKLYTFVTNEILLERLERFKDIFKA